MSSVHRVCVCVETCVSIGMSHFSSPCLHWSWLWLWLWFNIYNADQWSGR